MRDLSLKKRVLLLGFLFLFSSLFSFLFFSFIFFSFFFFFVINSFIFLFFFFSFQFIHFKNSLMGEPVEQVAQENQGNPPAPGSIVEIPEEDDQSREISSSSSSSSTTTQKESKNQRKKKKKKGVEKVEEVVVEEREKGDLKEKILKNLDEGRVANDETSKEDLLLLD